MNLETEVLSFRDLVVWQRAIDLSVAVYRVTDGFPRSERFGLTNQLRRASSSVAANIAEGHSHSSRRDYAHFVSIARGSLAETRSYVELANRLGYAAPSALADIEKRSAEISKMLAALRSRLARVEPR